MKSFFSLLLLILLQNLLLAQNEANVWYFGLKCGLDYNQGEPVILYDGFLNGATASATISDSLGNFLFTCQAGLCYTRQGILAYSENVVGGGHSGIAIVQWPGHDNMYFIISSVLDYWEEHGLHYSIVDLDANNGLGAVIEENIVVGPGWDASDRVAIVKQENSEYIWVVTRKFIEDAMVSFLIDDNGFNPNPIISPMPNRDAESDMNWGNIRISSDKKYLVSSYANDCQFEICEFNSKNGTINYLYTQKKPSTDLARLEGIEFSPDAKFLYVSYVRYNSADTNRLFQYEMKYASDSAMFHNSALQIASGSAWSLQMARDGKIYCTPNKNVPESSKYYMSVIEKPWIRGVACEFNRNAINMFPNRVGDGLPNILVDYLLRFEWTGEPCQGYPIQFKPNFIPTPDRIIWNFEPICTRKHIIPTFTDVFV